MSGRCKNTRVRTYGNRWLKKNAMSRKYKHRNPRTLKIYKRLSLSQNGGEPAERQLQLQLLTRMREHRDAGGKFVLVLGSSLNDLHCSAFAASKDCMDKMLISIDESRADAENNFNLDFNLESTWVLLREFNEQFHTVIFDYSVDKFIEGSEVDIIDEIKNLLMVGGKMYKYFSYGEIPIPCGTVLRMEERPFSDMDSYNIMMQFAKLGGVSPLTMGAISRTITSIKFCRTKYGDILPNGMDVATAYTMQCDTPGQEQLTAVSYRARTIPFHVESDQPDRSLNVYMKSLFAHYQGLAYSNILTNHYKFKIKLVENCSTYPLKNPSRPTILRYANDKCYVICTKTKVTPKGKTKGSA